MGDLNLDVMDNIKLFNQEINLLIKTIWFTRVDQRSYYIIILLN